MRFSQCVYVALPRKPSNLGDWMHKKNLLLVREAKTRHSTAYRAERL